MTPSRSETLTTLRKNCVVAIIRSSSETTVISAAEAIAAGGVRSIEVTMNTPGALNHIRSLVTRMGNDVLIGAGTVTSIEQVRASSEAGARFLVTPFSTEEIIHEANQREVPVLSGAFTPGEIANAHAWGADVVKVFPAEFFGPAYIKSVLAPLDNILLMPSGGISADNAKDWLNAGAALLGVGSALYNQRLAEAGDYDAMKKNAEKLMKAVAGRTVTAEGTR